MRTSFVFSLVAFLAFQLGWSQKQTTLITAEAEISDNLDLRAVASLLGDAQSLEDFEYKLNDPNLRISNLDLNGDRQVDYIRVVENIDNGTHLIVLQAVLERDIYQDIATIEVEKRGTTYVTQIVGNPYFYGVNYIYEPVYVSRPAWFGIVFQMGYRPYVSPWYYGYYPRHFVYWNPFPVYRYRKHIHQHINVHYHYNLVHVRQSTRAPQMYTTIRHNAYEVRHPQQAFAVRHQNVSNRAQLVAERPTTGRNANRATTRVNPSATAPTRGVGAERTTTERTLAPTTNRNGVRTTSTRVDNPSVSARSAATAPARTTATSTSAANRNTSVARAERPTAPVSANTTNRTNSNAVTPATRTTIPATPTRVNSTSTASRKNTPAATPRVNSTTSASRSNSSTTAPRINTAGSVSRNALSTARSNATQNANARSNGASNNRAAR